MKLVEGGVYKHFTVNLYMVEGTVIHSESGEEMVLYMSLKDNIRYVRPLEMFLSKVDREKYPDVNQEYRFQLQDIESVNQ